MTKAEPEIRGDEGQRLAQVRRVYQSKLGRRLHPEFLGQLADLQCRMAPVTIKGTVAFAVTASSSETGAMRTRRPRPAPIPRAAFVGFRWHCCIEPECAGGSPAKWRLSFMEGRQEGVEPLDRAYDLSSLSGEVEAVGRGDRSMQQCRATCTRAIDQFGQVIDVFVSPHRDVKAARRFFRQAIGATKVMPAEVTTDQAPVYPGVLEALLPAAWHRTDQYTNNGDRVRPRPAEGSTATDARPEAGP